MVSATRAPNNHTTWLRPMGPTDCLAPWTDRSCHLSPLAAPAQPAGGSCRPADLLSGECRCTGHPRAIVTLTRRQQLPGDTGNLVGKRHSGKLRRLALQQRHYPRRWMAATTPGLLDHRGRTGHQYVTQSLISGTGDLAEPGLTCGGMVFRGQPEPGRKMPAGGERARIGRLHYQRRGADETYPRNLRQTPAIGIGAVPGL